MFFITIWHQVRLLPKPYGLIGMYCVKCKQSNSQTCLTTLCLIVTSPWLNLPIGGHGHVIYMVIWGDFYLPKFLQKAAHRPTKVHFFYINKYVGEMVIMKCFHIMWFIMKSSKMSCRAESEGSFKSNVNVNIKI